MANDDLHDKYKNVVRYMISTSEEELVRAFQGSFIPLVERLGEMSDELMHHTVVSVCLLERFCHLAGVDIEETFDDFWASILDLGDGV